MQCAHFIYGQFNNAGYKLIKSPNLDQLLNNESVNQLIIEADRAVNKNNSGHGQICLPNKAVIAIYDLYPTKDRANRIGVWIHVKVVKIEDYLNLCAPHIFQIFSSHVIKSLDKIPQSLEPLKIET